MSPWRPGRPLPRLTWAGLVSSPEDEAERCRPVPSMSETPVRSESPSVPALPVFRRSKRFEGEASRGD